MIDDEQLAARFLAGWHEIADIGLRRDGGYDRFSFTHEDMALRSWFADQARRRSMHVEVDRNANLWAWRADGEGRAIVTGSHLDSVPGGGAFDGPLGIWSAFLALDLLEDEGVPLGPISVVDWTDEEGARFGVACLGSRLSSGVLAPERARALVDREGVTLEEAMRRVGYNPDELGADIERLDSIGAFVELHVEQGRALVDLDAPVGVASIIWPHGRWRVVFEGEANHAGTARLEDRRDPVLSFALFVQSVRECASRLGGLATVGKAFITPNATNGVAARVDSWLDARAPDQATLVELVARIEDAARVAARSHGVEVRLVEESLSSAVLFDERLRGEVVKRLAGVPVISTGAGHDAGVLAGRLATAMLFVRNPSGVSHSPHERAELADCIAGVRALAVVLAGLS